MRKRLLMVSTVFLIFFIWFIDTLANRFFWYSAIPWFDNLMHFTGGLWLGLVATLAITEYGLFKRYRGTSREMLVSFLLMFTVAIYWEVFEFGVQNVIQFVHLADIPDSIMDLCFDTLGWALGYGIVHSVLRIKNKENSL